MLINLEKVRHAKDESKVKRTLEETLINNLARRNELEYQKFLETNNLEKSWETWDVFASQKWGY